MTDYRINLAKTLTSSEEQRCRFYHRMIVYLALCSAAIVYAGYYSSCNAVDYLESKQECRVLLDTAAAVSGFEEVNFRNPDKAYAELQLYSDQIAALRQVLSEQVQLLPVVHNLFKDLPKDVTLQSLAANRNKMTFGMVVPLASEAAGDPVRKLKAAWEKNEELMKRVGSITPVKGERHTTGDSSVYYMQFECVLKK